MGFWSGLGIGLAIGAASLGGTLFVLSRSKRANFNHNHFD
jgi:hypothetical protein